MRALLKTTWFGIKETYSNKNYVWIFIIAFVVMFSLFVLIPVSTVDGNDLATQFEILNLQDYLVIILLSGIYALFVPMQVFVMKKRKRVKEIGGVVGGGVGALFAGIAGTAFCASCLAPLFALFGIGFGGLIFVLEYRMYFVIGIIILMLIAIYFTAKKIGDVCETC